MGWGEVEQAEELGGGGNYVDKPCHAHCLITEVDDNPVAKDQTPLNGIKVTFMALEATVKAQKGRTTEITFWTPDPEKKGSKDHKRQTALCIATCLIGHHQPGVKVNINPKDMVGRQVVCKFDWKQKYDEASKKWLDTDRIDIAFADIFHVDDSNVSKNALPLDAASIAMIPAALRKPVTVNQGGNGGGTGPAVSPAALVNGTRSGVNAGAAAPAAASIADL